MSSPLFPSGPWVGFYQYTGHKQYQFPMAMKLGFGNGQMNGEGEDEIGPFFISGHYSEIEKECLFVKAYVGAHTVNYRGFREDKFIYGTWRLNNECTGGFKLWPLSDTEPLETEKTEVEKPLELIIGPAASSVSFNSDDS